MGGKTRKKGTEMKTVVKDWLVFYGTLTTTVRAVDEDGAFKVFLNQRDQRRQHSWRSDGKDFGGFVPPTRDEVTIRLPTERDRGWIEDSGDKRFIALLSQLVEA